LSNQKDKFLNDIKNKKNKSKSNTKPQHNKTTQTQKDNTNKYTITRKETNTDSGKVRRNFYIPVEIDNYLNKVSNQTNRSKSELVETAIKIMQKEVEIK